MLSSGYAANLAAVTALTGAGGLIVSDAGNHASLIDGCRLSRAAHRRRPARRPRGRRARRSTGTAAAPLAVTDSVFSVDGDAAPLPALAAACRDARRRPSSSTTRTGSACSATAAAARRTPPASPGRPTWSRTATLSKSLGSQGGAVLGPARVIEHLVNAARTFIFDTGLAPAAAGRALAALRLLRREPERAARAAQWRAALHRRLTAPGLTAARAGRLLSSRSGRPSAGRGGALGGGLPCRGTGRRLLPAAVRAGRRLPAAADRPRGPDGTAGRRRGRRDRGVRPGRRRGVTAPQRTRPYQTLRVQIRSLRTTAPGRGECRMRPFPA